MYIEFKNGSTVHEVWKDLPEGTLKAAFQYFDDATAFAEAAMDRVPGEVSLVVVDHGSGELRRFVKPSASDSDTRENG